MHKSLISQTVRIFEKLRFNLDIFDKFTRKDTISCIVQLLSHFKLYMIDDQKSIDLSVVTKIVIVTIMQTRKISLDKHNVKSCVLYFLDKVIIQGYHVSDDFIK